MVITICSVGSVILSSSVRISNGTLLEPAGIFTVYTPVKSEPSVAVPLYLSVTVTSVCGGLVKVRV